MIARLRRLTGDVRGTALVEFAMVLPALIVLFFGGYQLTDALACKRRVTIMTRAIGDVTSQYRKMTQDDMKSVMDASAQIMSPYSVAPVKIRVTQITINATGLGFSIDWSEAMGGLQEYPTGNYPMLAQIPVGFRQPGMTFIATETSYKYDSAMTKYFSAIDFSDQIWLLPRQSPKIVMTSS